MGMSVLAASLSWPEHFLPALLLELMVDYWPGIWSKSKVANRLDRLRHEMLNHNLEYIALTPGPSLYYLTGLSFHLMERPILMLIPATGTPLLIAPDLEISKAERSRIPLERISYGESDAARLEAFSMLADFHNAEIAEIGVEPSKMRYLEMSLLEQSFQKVRIVSAQECLDSLRILKEPEEIEASQRAVHIAEQAMQATLAQIKIGMTELELANELVIQLLRHGSEPEVPFAPIVASGPNSALPHASPSARKLRKGDVLILDWGAAYESYFSDLTRTFGIGKPGRQLQEVHQVVFQANLAAREAVFPGSPCSEIDQAARSVIERAGYGEHFIHRTGHGLGLEAHEPPYIRSDNSQEVLQGMLFTIEPGIYLPAIGGVRIEDDVVVTEAGVRSLSSLPRELIILG
jgi:Xaa-Pro dipeptidase